MSDIASIRKTAEAHGQGHMLKFWDELSPSQQTSLLQQLAGIDFNYLDELIAAYIKNKPICEIPGNIQPPTIMPVRPQNQAQEAEYAAARKKGQDLIAAGKVAAFVVAGGQGSRLGYEGPKGCLEATPVVRKPLFRLFAEQIMAASKRARVPIPWYIMTSPDNDVATKAHFRQNDFWGFNHNDVIFFAQGQMPAFGFDGKLVMARKDRLAMSPNGHGGSLLAMQTSGALDDMAKRGVEYISYFQVDNPLVRCLDPLFIGLHALQGAEMSAKCLPKRDPMEKLGNFCVVNGRVAVIEYSDLPEHLARACNPDGRLKFSAGSIAIHVLSRSFVERLTKGGRCSLPWHRADKKVPCIDPAGGAVNPEKPNAVKIEMFVFDALPLAQKTVILETRRDEEFSPIKNAAGEDSLSTSLHAQVRRWTVWLEQAGIKVPRDADGQVSTAIEISPLFADSAEELARKADRNITISVGQSFYLGSRGQIGGAR
ncbi:MAG: UDPGP type 1 family protein [Planctomycetes bacterium]|nr:UDPGP type 1 family protein [Planctomycetota bacterium]